ncbi:uncharacterized protein LOC130686695 [Daphnia carinata]|uniref:uncharacterized protein LOC130686695 n=1 Tax=Daphnia carinata TaxID=120202 RepID=UPI00257BAAEE|nr:uncharacterized protein LOC130686695 [Daphnia carinata]
MKPDNRQENGGDGSSSAGLAEDGLPEQDEPTSCQIRISLNTNNDVYSKIREAIRRAKSLGVVSKSDRFKGRAWVRNRGKLSYDCKWLVNNEGLRKCEPKIFLNSPRQTSSNRRRIFQGFHEYDIPVAIEKKLIREDLLSKIEREFRILRELNIHENFIRYFCYETDETNDFVYIATELCLCSIADIFEQKSVNVPLKTAILSSLTVKGILFQATRGLDYLHQNHFVHRNVKPSSFLVKEVRSGNGSIRYAIKITDFRLSRMLDPDKDLSGTVASEGWESPESRRKNQPLHQSLDVFILGCFYYYILTGTDDGDARPTHPFGDGEGARLMNIRNSKYFVYKEKWQPSGLQNETAIALMKQMIQFDEKQRPSLSQVLDHEYFRPPLKEHYPIYDSNKPGLCVIFNQEYFSALPHRAGSEHDWTNLKCIFLKLGFDVVVHHDLMSYDIKGEMEKLAARDFSQYGCLVVCLLSHGIENAIAGFDGHYVNINKLKYKFSYNFCPSLYGKPKIFIVQACQGDLEQSQTQVVPLTFPGSDSAEGNKESTVLLSPASAVIKYISNCFKSFNVTEDKLNRNPPIMDFMTIKSTIPGFVSLRNACTGTYFIQALCQKMEEEYLISACDGLLPDDKNIRDLEGILRGENGVQSTMNNKIQNKEYRQTISCETYLRKYIVFRRSNQIVFTDDDAKDNDSESSNRRLAERNNFFVNNSAR